MMRRTALVLLAALAGACGPPEPAHTASGPAPPVVLDERWLAPLDLPDMAGKPLIGITDGRDDFHAAIVLEDFEDRITTFDGIAVKSYRRDRTMERSPLGDRRALALLTARTDVASTLKAAVIASVSARSGRKELAQAVLQRLAKSTEDLR